MDEGKDKKEKEEKPEQRPGYIPPKHLKSIESIISELIWGAINGTLSPEEAVKYAQEQILRV